MSRRSGIVPKLDLKLNLSPPRGNTPPVQSPSRSLTVSPPSSCVSTELNQEENCFSNSPEATMMIVAGCTRCLMYVMLPEKEQPRCPKCKSTVLLEVFNYGGNGHGHGTKSKTQQE